MIEVGQLRQWKYADPDAGIFMVISIDPINEHGDEYVNYIMEGVPGYDDVDWVETWSEVVSD